MVAERHGCRVKVVSYKVGDWHHTHQLAGLEVHFSYRRLLVTLLLFCNEWTHTVCMNATTWALVVSQQHFVKTCHLFVLVLENLECFYLTLFRIINWKLYSKMLIMYLPKINLMYLPSGSKSVSNSSSVPWGWVGDGQSSSFKQRDSKDSVDIAVCCQSLGPVWNHFPDTKGRKLCVHVFLCVLYGQALWNESTGLLFCPAGNPIPQVTCHA